MGCILFYINNFGLIITILILYDLVINLVMENCVNILSIFFNLKFSCLKALVHVSTAYCNCDREEVNEVIYPPPYDPEKIIQCTEWMDDDLIEALTPK